METKQKKQKMKAASKKKKKEGPIKCEIFTFKQSGTDVADKQRQITEFFSDGKKLVEVAQSSIVSNREVFTFVTIFYRDKEI